MQKQVDRAKKINQLHESFCEGIRTSLTIAIELGELLVAQKKECGHGNWLPWIEANLSFTSRTAFTYMRCFHKRAELSNRKTTSDLTIENVAREIAKPSKQELDAKKRQDAQLDAKAKKIAEERVKLDKEQEDINRQKAEDETVEMDDADLEFEDLNPEESDEDFEKRVKAAETLTREALEEERSGKSHRKHVEFYWDLTTKNRSKEAKKYIAKAMLQFLLKKYPQLMDEAV